MNTAALPSRTPRALFLPALLALAVTGCSHSAAPAKTEPAAQPKPVYFHGDPATAGSISGEIHFSGHKPAMHLVDMSDDPACVHAHHGRQYEQSIVLGPRDGLANVFVYVEKGLEGKTFEAPSTPVVIDQTGCWFVPRVLGVQVGQPIKIINSDPVTHNIHPQAEINRAWNHSQGPGDPPIERRFTRPEIMIPVKCNIHSWMHAWIGVLPYPYFAVSNDKGSFFIPDLPPGTYTIAAWQEKLGTQRQTITIAPGQKANLSFKFSGSPAK